MPYVLPMNFGYELIGDKFTLYFHSAKVGEKIDIINENSNACFEMNHMHELIEGPRGCDYSTKYERVMGSGKISFCLDLIENEKPWGY